MFYTADSSRSTTEHYGIGLAFASKVVHVHQGELLLENKCEGTGGCVIFKFPKNRVF